jgi:hypothetical protein
VRTGYDAVIAHRTYDLFAYTAKKPGIVKSLDEVGIVVEYTDGETQGYEIGRRFGNAAGLIIPHSVVTNLKIGDSIAVGDVIVYNTGFFEPDFFNPKQIVLKNSATVKTVLWESSQTLEDASTISTKSANLLKTKLTKKKDIVVSFDQSVSNLVKVGQVVDADSILCIIQDAVTADNKLFDDQSIDTLRAVSGQSPRAHVKGIVERIEIFYHGDKEDMSLSLQELATKGDKELKKRATSLEQPVYSGSVDGGFRIDSDQLGLDSLAIRIYITSEVTASVGD